MFLFKVLKISDQTEQNIYNSSSNVQGSPLRKRKKMEEPQTKKYGEILSSGGTSNAVRYPTESTDAHNRPAKNQAFPQPIITEGLTGSIHELLATDAFWKRNSHLYQLYTLWGIQQTPENTPNPWTNRWFGLNSVGLKNIRRHEYKKEAFQCGYREACGLKWMGNYTNKIYFICVWIFQRTY